MDVGMWPRLKKEIGVCQVGPTLKDFNGCNNSLENVITFVWLS